MRVIQIIGIFHRQLDAHPSMVSSPASWRVSQSVNSLYFFQWNSNWQIIIPFFDSAWHYDSQKPRILNELEKWRWSPCFLIDSISCSGMNQLSWNTSMLKHLASPKARIIGSGDPKFEFPPLFIFLVTSRVTSTLRGFWELPSKLPFWINNNMDARPALTRGFLGAIFHINEIAIWHWMVAFKLSAIDILRYEIVNRNLNPHPI